MLSWQLFLMIIKRKLANQNHPAIEQKTTLVTIMVNTNTSFRPLVNRQKRKKQTPIKIFLQRTVLKYCKTTSKKKKKDHDLNENDPADNNNSDSIKDKEIKNLVQKHKNKNSYNSYFRRFDIKIKINMCIPFERLQNVRRTLL